MEHLKVDPRLAVYPGTFDPLTKGHFSIMYRGLKIFDRVILGIAVSTPKKTLFSLEERMALAREVFRDYPNVLVESFDGLTIDYAARRGAGAILRGMRAVSDFEYEFQMALMNRKLAPELETVFLMPKEKYSAVSSRLVREIGSMGGALTDLVPEKLRDRIADRLRS